MDSDEQARFGEPNPQGLGDHALPVRPRNTWGSDELDELLAGPDGTTRVGEVLAAAGAPTEGGKQPGEEAALRAFREAFPVSRAVRGPRVLVARVSGRAAAAALAGGLVLSGGAAAAAAGALPGPAQQTAKAVLAKVGVSVPGPNGHAEGRPDRHDRRTQTPVRPAERPGTGKSVPGQVRSTASTGVDKGAAVSGTASDGKSQAGQHGTTRRNGNTHQHEAGRSPTTPPTSSPPTPGRKGGRG